MIEESPINNTIPSNDSLGNTTSEDNVIVAEIDPSENYFLLQVSFVYSI